MVKGDPSIKIGAIVQARVNSTRLPNKVLLSLPYSSNTSVLDQVIGRAQKIETVNEVIIAATNDKVDDAIESASDRLNVKCFRGDERNVLRRFFFAAKQNDLDVIVRLTADNPCIDFDLINSISKLHIKEKNDYTATKSYPLGMNVEIVSFEAIKKAATEASTSLEKEHVTPYIYTNPDKFKISEKEAPKDCRHPDIRLTLDTEEDYALLCAVFDYLCPANKFFGMKDLIDLFKEKPWLRLINKKVLQKKMFNTLDEEIKEAIKILDLQDFKKVKHLLKGYAK